ncbi:Maf-like protein YhdE [Ascidiaceihabitans donghaensis]|uniref:dTTP/UTP pyrophosphatase n=1 Tax=Ascidiaceihabitans donghaensis TaxID=1510460 RepID=A0A2R8BB64_9RHOB|nr:Maf family protein [Ascidiaceihabitans donghaensis]SPH20320.1 Maf-like protein YhdE [Ascidiaceihabitans donghaensis]
MAFILGSGSPRRLELLGQIGVVPDAVRAPDIDETPLKAELPRPYCNRVTAQKVAAVEADFDDIVLCADTTVALGRRIMGKPDDAAQAAEYLWKLSGRRHRVITSVAVKRGDRVWQKDVVSSVRVKALSNVEVNAYLATGDWQGKAGGYAIQGPAGAFIPWISGSFSAIMGLPVTETAGLLMAAGYPLYKEAP